MRSAPPLPYARVNLRRNPFGTPDPEERAALGAPEAGALVEAVGERLEAGPRARPLAVQLVGPPGSGKSTRLAAVAARFPDAPLVGWSADGGWPPLPPGRLLLVDDAHMLSWWARRRIGGRRALVAASQRDLAGALRRRGYELRTVEMPPVTLERLRALVDRRLEWARRGPGPLPRVADADLADLLERHGPDVRAVLDRLYDRIQRLA